ncbi:hypothetical protein [Micropruina sonneratiae]|uniref:hypothetical protein n=1 Tax=Micropruina sonneratiae TaxID=2986940 RepID=UPI00222792DC|nr:hypothetical protein [Micropruina sp. KQZ13P-5]MCW3157816.1 hypothetical protein [Micropruina sp. KQZ13P-5]
MAKRTDRSGRTRREREIAARSATAKKSPAKASAPAGDQAGATASVKAADSTAAAKSAGAKASTTPAGKAAVATRPRREKRVRADRVGIGSELAERVAWSMLAGLAALIGTGLVLALAGAIVPALCPEDDGTCTVGWMVLVGGVSYVLALLGACAIGGLGIWFWVAYLIGFAPLAITAMIGEWWWWTALAVLPALAGIASSPFGRPTQPRAQRIVLIVLAVLAVATAVWWFVFAAQ